MPVVENRIVINAPMEVVFGVLDDPERLPEHFPGVVSVSDFKQTLERVGDSANITYSVIGVRFDVPFSILEWDENKRIVSSLGGAFPGVVTTTFESQVGGVRVTQRFDYSIKGGIVGKALNAILVERMNEKNAERSLENIKMICEAG
jgi:carbon monoxide dehydrogenase subunit G